MSLPELPPVLCHAGDSDCYTPDQMTEYGKECRAAAFEEAAFLCDGEKWFNDKRPIPYINAFNDGCEECQLAIRRLK